MGKWTELRNYNLRRGLMLMWPFDSKKKTMDKAARSCYFSIKETTEGNEFKEFVNKLKEVLNNTSREVIFLCVGSDRSTGDSLGPLVGTMLKETDLPFPVYGTLEKPVHALNINKILKEINQTHKDPFILGIDACLGDERQIGFIFLKEGSLIPGMAVNKKLPHVGEYHMKAVVNYLDPLSPVQSLNNTRLFTVMTIAEVMTKIITQAALGEGSFSNKPIENLSR
ncbi:spore protease YyaC [Bacillus sp. X1(2014)]|uniref:spore protease YyaC n=1 Tax=Bacillus sp. X1(2014) TaxID=1565991 RepID=UPI0021B2BCE7|nr:spore protease YyaC [Bacillus sp. X1(2014)]